MSLKNRVIIAWSHFRQKPWDIIIDNWFSRIALLQRSDEEKAEISISISEQNRFSRLYWMELILSAFIAALGMFQNSVAIIIGAMLIAPLLRPIQGMAFGIALGRSRFFYQALRFLIFSILVSISIGILVSYLVPLSNETEEMLSRTTPNLLDLFIAGGSAVIAFLSIGYSRLLGSIAGVAMATSLMPPLVVVGIEFSFKNLDKVWGSFLLFVTNLIAILFVGVIMFILYGFNPHQEESTKTLRRIGMILLFVGILWIPLFSSLHRINDQENLQNIIRQEINSELKLVAPEAAVNRLVVQSTTKDSITLRGSLHVPQKVTDFSANVLNGVVHNLQQKVGKVIYLDLEIIRTFKNF